MGGDSEGIHKDTARAGRDGGGRERLRGRRSHDIPCCVHSFALTKRKNGTYGPATLQVGPASPASPASVLSPGPSLQGLNRCTCVPVSGAGAPGGLG